MKGNLKEMKGVTLIALVITIIVLLILAGVSIAMLTGDNGLLTKASETKILTALGTIKEQIELDRTANLMDNKNVTVEQLLADGKIKRTVQADGEIYYMYYAIKSDAYQGMQGLGKGNVVTLKDVFLIDDEFHIKYVDKSGKEYGDDIGEKILDDETEVRFSSKAFSDYVSRISGVTETEMKFKWMKNQTSLRIEDSSIDSLEDLVFFPNLTRLNIAGGVTLENLKGIENCQKLKSFIIESRCGVNDFSALKFLTSLTQVESNSRINFDDLIESIKGNNITVLSVSVQKDTKSMKKVEQLPNLVTLVLSDGEQLTKIEGVKELRHLKTIGIVGANLREITELEYLDLLESVNFKNNDIRDITVLANNNNLKEIYLQGNTNLNADRSSYSSSELEKIDKIGEILNNGGNIYLDSDKLKLFNNYRKLDLAGQNLKDLSVIEGMNNLEVLNLSHNNLVTLSDENSRQILRGLTKLKTIKLSYNLELTDISGLNELNSLTNLDILYCPVNLKQIEDKISNLSIETNVTNMLSLMECNKEKITSIKIGLADVEQIPDFEEFLNLETLSISLLRAKTNINIDTISRCKSLVNLTIGGINLHEKMIDFSKLTNLTNIGLGGNALWSEDLENLKVLKNNSNLTINLSNNSIIDASSLLVLNSSCKINLRNNVNLTQESKDALIARFGSNVIF